MDENMTHEVLALAVQQAWRTAEEANAMAERCWQEYDDQLEAAEHARHAALTAEDLAVAARREAQRLVRAARHQRAQEARRGAHEGTNGNG